MSRCDLCEFSLEEHLLNHMELVFCENKLHSRSLSSLNILKYSAENFPLEYVTITQILIYFKVNSFFISFQNKCIFRNLIFFQLWYIVPFLSTVSEEKKWWLCWTLSSCIFSSNYQPTSPTYPYLQKRRNY